MPFPCDVTRTKDIMMGNLGGLKVFVGIKKCADTQGVDESKYEKCEECHDYANVMQTGASA